MVKLDRNGIIHDIQMVELYVQLRLISFGYHSPFGYHSDTISTDYI